MLAVLVLLEENQNITRYKKENYRTSLDVVGSITLCAYYIFSLFKLHSCHIYFTSIYYINSKEKYITM